MNLVADIGNSFTKIGIFDGEEMIHLEKVGIFTPDLASVLVSNYKIDAAIVSSVSAGYEDVMEIFGEFSQPLFLLSASMPLPFRIGYDSPGTLGSDRIAGIAGAHNKFPDTNVLVVDAGTAVTYDLLLSNNNYPGGNISPGLYSRFRALNHFTGKLPLVEPGITTSELGTDTESAIRTGVQSGLIFEINEYIRRFESRYKNLEVILTGGDSLFLKDYLNFRFTFAPDLIVEGLNHILNYNVKTT